MKILFMIFSRVEHENTAEPIRSAPLCFLFPENYFSMVQCMKYL